MGETATKLPIKQDISTPSGRRGPSLWQPFESLREEVDHIFEEFTRGLGRWPLDRRVFEVKPWSRYESAIRMAAPVVDVVENASAYQVLAELPGLHDKDIEVSVADDVLIIKGEKKEEKEERAKNYHLSERRYGTFQRTFQLPLGVDADKIEANFREGVLTVTLPKTPEAQKKEKKIAITPK